MSAVARFVGLIIPHMMRLLPGPDHRVAAVVASAIACALFLVSCDLIGRTILPKLANTSRGNYSIVGAPYFLYLLHRMQQGGGR